MCQSFKVAFQARCRITRGNIHVVLVDPVHEGRLVHEHLENSVLVT